MKKLLLFFGFLLVTLGPAAFSAHYVVDTLADYDDGSNLYPDPGNVTLRKALRWANSNGESPDLITFHPDLDGGVIVLDSALGTLRIQNEGDTTVDATGVDITIDGSNLSFGTTVLEVAAPNATIRGLAIKGGFIGMSLNTVNIKVTEVSLSGQSFQAMRVGSSCEVEDVEIAHAGTSGMDIVGTNSVIRRVKVENSGHGIEIHGFENELVEIECYDLTASGIILYVGADGNRIQDVVIRNAGEGFTVYGDSNEIIDAEIDTVGWGMYFAGASWNRVQGGEITNASSGAVFISPILNRSSVGNEFEGMEIHHNAVGIVVEDDTSVGHIFTANSIYSNHGLGIDLGHDGVTLNDGLLGSPNLGVDYPIFTAVELMPDGLHVRGFINVEAAGSGSSEFADAVVEVFLVRSGPDGDDLVGNEYGGKYYGEGWRYLGEIIADSNGEFSGVLEVEDNVFYPEFLVTGTTTIFEVGTSEFGPTRQGEGWSADVEISKGDIPDPAATGETLVFTITVINHGPGDAQEVSVIDTLPSGVEVVGLEPSQGNATLSGGIISWFVGDLATDGSATLEVRVRAPDEAGTIENLAEVSSSTHDPNPTNNYTRESTSVVQIHDLTGDGILDLRDIRVAYLMAHGCVPPIPAADLDGDGDVDLDDARLYAEIFLGGD